MKTLITLTIAFAIFSNCSFANPGQPVSKSSTKSLVNSVKKANAYFENTSSAKICACQLLRVSSNNDKNKLIAVFAQASNNGDLSSGFNIAQTVLSKEKKHIQDFFYSKVKVQENLTAVYPCSMMYKNLKVKYDEVEMYDVLDADALSNINIQGKR